INSYTLEAPSPFVLFCKKMIGILAHTPHIGDTPEKFKRARSQDFFDIHSLIDCQMIHLQDLIQPNHLSIFQTMLTEKNIETSSLKNLKKHCEFHQSNFTDSVQDMSLLPLKTFEYYFDCIIHLIDYMYPFLTTLKSLKSSYN
ncbi:nucleotidyl transferase AbiEii/AbiGii toxin family protein, partial [Bacillus cereus]